MDRCLRERKQLRRKFTQTTNTLETKLKEAQTGMVTIELKISAYLHIRPLKSVDRFKAFINWIKQTPKSSYSVGNAGGGDYVVTQITAEDHSLMDPIESSVSTEQAEKYAYTESVVSSIQSTSTENKPFGRADLFKDKMTSQSRSILAQLKKGILIPAKRSMKPSKKITAHNSGLRDSEILAILVKNPDYDMPALIKEIYKRKGTWQLINNICTK